MDRRSLWTGEGAAVGAAIGLLFGLMLGQPMILVIIGFAVGGLGGVGLWSARH
jgi:uncharacterized membrane protein